MLADSGADDVFCAPATRCPTGRPLAVDDVEPRRAGRDLLHQRHHRLPQGRDDQPRELPVQRRDRDPRDRHRPDDGPATAQPRVGAAVPRHRLQQPAAPAGRAARHHGGPARLRRPRRSCARPSRSASTCSPACPRSTRWRWPSRTSPTYDLTSVRRIAYGGAPIAPDARPPHPGGVPERAGRQRLRPHRDLLHRHVPAPRVGGRARRLRGLRRAGRRPRAGRARSTASASSWSAGRTSSSGYWNKPDATAATFVDGWLHTGDLARIDDGPRPDRRPRQGHDQPRRRERLLRRGRERAGGRARRRGGRGRRRAGRRDGREGRRGDRAAARAAVRRSTAMLAYLARAPRRLQGAAVRRAAERAAAAQPRRQDPQAAPCATAPSGGRRCAELSPSRAAVHRFADRPRAAARRTTLQA